MLLAIEDLSLLFLTKTETLACVIKIGPQSSPDIMKTVASWLRLSNSGELMNAPLYEHLDELRNMYIEARMADVQHITPPAVKSHMTFTKTNAGTGQSGKGLVSIHGGAQKSAKVPSGAQRTQTDWSSQTCNVCRKNHHCPKLDSYQQKQGKFASNCCDKCLFAKNSAGVC